MAISRAPVAYGRLSAAYSTAMIARRARKQLDPLSVMRQLSIRRTPRPLLLDEDRRLDGDHHVGLQHILAAAEHVGRLAPGRRKARRHAVAGGVLAEVIQAGLRITPFSASWARSRRAGLIFAMRRRRPRRTILCRSGAAALGLPIDPLTAKRRGVALVGAAELDKPRVAALHLAFRRAAEREAAALAGHQVHRARRDGSSPPSASPGRPRRTAPARCAPRRPTAAPSTPRAAIAADLRW